MKKFKKLAGDKGFTIIELIVVIAIIAVLAAIVLVNVTAYIAKGRDAAIRGNMATIMINAAVYFDGKVPTTYVGFPATAGYTQPVVAITDAGGTMGTPQATATGFCVSATLNDGTTWCVDSTGYKGTTANCDATNADCQ